MHVEQLLISLQITLTMVKIVMEVYLFGRKHVCIIIFVSPSVVEMQINTVKLPVEKSTFMPCKIDLWLKKNSKLEFLAKREQKNHNN
jgi:hypothetical protein